MTHQILQVGDYDFNFSYLLNVIPQFNLPFALDFNENHPWLFLSQLILSFIINLFSVVK